MAKKNTYIYDGLGIVLLLIIGALVMGLPILLLGWLSKESLTPSGTIGAFTTGYVIIGIVTGLILKYKRDWSLLSTYFIVMMAAVPLYLFLFRPGITWLAERLPIPRVVYESASSVLISIFILYVAIVIIYKVKTRRLVKKYIYRGASKRSGMTTSATQTEQDATTKAKEGVLTFSAEETVTGNVGGSSFVVSVIAALLIGYIVGWAFDYFANNPYSWVWGVLIGIGVFVVTLVGLRLIIGKSFWDDTYETKGPRIELDPDGTVREYDDLKLIQTFNLHDCMGITDKTEYYDAPNSFTWISKLEMKLKNKKSKTITWRYSFDKENPTSNSGNDKMKTALGDFRIKAQEITGLEACYDGKTHFANTRSSGSTTQNLETGKTKSEIDLQMALTALSYDLQSDVVNYNDNLTDEQKARVLGTLAGLEINEMRDLREQRKDAGKDNSNDD